MASNPPGDCCNVGMKHDGDLSGKLSTIADGSIDVYIATPENPKPGKAILFIPDAMGIYNNSQLVADEFAAKGYYTLLLDLFNKDPMPLNRPPGFSLTHWLKHGSTSDNPHTTKEVDVIVTKGVEYLKAQGYTDIGSVGYCFGAKYVIRFQSEAKGAPIKVGFVAHPSLVEEDELAAIKGPLSIAAAEKDKIFTMDLRHKSEQILAATMQPYQISLFSGVSHGFAIRGDLGDKQEKWAKEQAFDKAIKWFEFHL